MLIEQAKLEPDGLKEIRIKIPAALHVKLHSIRLLKGKSISDAVTEALQEYFTTTAPRPLLPEGYAAVAANESRLAPHARPAWQT